MIKFYPVVLRSEVILLQNGHPVGKARLNVGLSIHGHDLPEQTVRVHILEIKESMPPPIPSTFDEDFLIPGQFACWPVDQIRGEKLIFILCFS